jgi:hypothetical protein
VWSTDFPRNSGYLSSFLLRKSSTQRLKMFEMLEVKSPLDLFYRFVIILMHGLTITVFPGSL